MMSQHHHQEDLWAKVENLPLVDRARTVATACHQGQQDKAGKPYIEHPHRVAGHARVRCEELGLSEEETETVLAAAWLHDVVEDTSVTEGELRAAFPEPVVTAVMAVTKRSGEPTEEYFERVRADGVARVVKAADLDDNTDPARTALLGKETRERLAAKYVRARKLLAG